MRDTAFGRLEVRDAHTHFFSHRFFATLASQSPELRDAPDPVARAGEVTGWAMPPEEPARLARQWVEELDMRGVSAALSIASVPGDEESVAAAVAAYPDRLYGAFMLDPTSSDAVTRAQEAFERHGLRVACLFPAMHHFSVAESEKVHAIASLAGEQPGRAVFVHFGALSVGVRGRLGLPSRFDIRFSNPLDLHSLACSMPSTKFIVPHFGAGMLREALMVADLCSNVYLDTSSSNKWMAYVAGVEGLASVFKRAIDVVGHERLLFGTDSSFFPRGWQASVFEAQVNALGGAGVTAEQARAILGDNLLRLLSPAS